MYSFDDQTAAGKRMVVQCLPNIRILLLLPIIPKGIIDVQVSDINHDK